MFGHDDTQQAQGSSDLEARTARGLRGAFPHPRMSGRVGLYPLEQIFYRPDASKQSKQTIQHTTSRGERWRPRRKHSRVVVKKLINDKLETYILTQVSELFR